MKKILLFFALIFYATIGISQGLTNHGAKINIAYGAYVTTGDFTNQTIVQDGEVILDGTLQVSGNITNNSNGNLFKEIENYPDGIIVLSGENMNISGQTAINFENIIINNIRKINLNNNNIFGTITIDGILQLNSNTLIISNSLADAIQYSSGYIKSESLPTENFGIIRWNIAENIGNYQIPFGSSNLSDNDLNVSLLITNVASSTLGYIDFATFPTSADNTPFPDDVLSLNNFQSDAMADRYWLIEPVFEINPDFTLTLSYSDIDLNTSSNPNLNTDSLRIIRYNPDDDTWSDLKITSTNFGNTIEADIIGNDIYKWFSIGSDSTIAPVTLVIPNGITPNEDGYNDTWIIEGIDNPTIYIYNRWGSKVYETQSYDNLWDGDTNPSGAYYYTLITSDNQTIKGIINIMR